MVSNFSPLFGLLRSSIGGIAGRISSSSPGGLLGGGQMGGGLLGTSEWVRTIIQINFPRPRETKRIRAHGWNTRMKTKGGRAIIMRRILKGRYILSH